MQRKLRLARLARVIGVALGYYVAGRLGLALAVGPGAATGILLASGIAVAGLLLCGPAALGGVLVASFAIHIEDPANASARDALVAGSIALAAVAQAWLAASLVRRRVGFPHALDTGRSVAAFLLLSGPVACLVNALWGPLTLLLAGLLPAHDYAASCFTWWVGDVLGVVVVLPIALTFFGEPRAVWRRRRTSVALPIALVFIAAVAAFVRTSQLEQARNQQEFDQRAAVLERALTARTESFVQVLASLRALFGASQQVDRREFHSFVEGVLNSSRGLRALGWLPRVRAQERRAFEAAAEREIPQFRIRPVDDLFGGASGQPQLGESAPPSAANDDLAREYYPILYLDPDPSGGRLFGRDLASEPRRQRALFQARDSGRPAATERLELLSSPANGVGVLVALAVYRPGERLEGVEARRAALLGLVLAGFGFDQLVSSAIGDPASRSIALRIDDVTPGARSIELYREPDPPARALRFALPYELGERVWRITFSANSGYAFMEQAWGAWSLLTTALLFCGVLGGFLLLLTGRAFELERTSREAEQLLATLVQSSHDAIIAYDPQGAIVGWNEGAARSFGWQEAEALGKRAELFVPPELQAEHADLLHRAAHGEHQPTYETVRLDKQGRRLEVAAKLSPIHTADGTARGASEICRDISQEKIKDRELRASLREKEILLKEVHHRVKNNLQVISSLLNLQSSYLPTPELRGLFGESQARVQSIALVHEQLYRSKDLAHVNFEDYIRMLASGVFQAQSRIGQPITYAVEAGQIHLNVDTSVPCGLIVNELMTNALKHAFPDGRPGNILVSLQNITEDRLELNVSDDGVGLPPELDPRKTTTLGLDLVFTLADQLDAEVTVDRSPGTNFKFTFRQVS